MITISVKVLPQWSKTWGKKTTVSLKSGQHELKDTTEAVLGVGHLEMDRSRARAECWYRYRENKHNSHIQDEHTT